MAFTEVKDEMRLKRKQHLQSYNILSFIKKQKNVINFVSIQTVVCLMICRGLNECMCIHCTVTVHEWVGLSIAL